MIFILSIPVSLAFINIGSLRKNRGGSVVLGNYHTLQMRSFVTDRVQIYNVSFQSSIIVSIHLDKN